MNKLLVSNSLQFLMLRSFIVILKQSWFGCEKLAVYVSNRVPEVVIGDPGRFRQIITNLVGNSIKVSNKSCPCYSYDPILKALLRLLC